MKIILNEKGTEEKTVNVQKIEIYDLWDCAMAVPNKEAQNAILTVWHLAHDLRAALCAIDAGVDLSKPIHTK